MPEWFFTLVLFFGGIFVEPWMSEPSPEPVRTATRILSKWDPGWTPENVARLHACESGGLGWAVNTGNGFYGGLQFSLSSWQLVGGEGRPDLATPEVQITAGKRLWDRQGWLAWPKCSCHFGWVSQWKYIDTVHTCPNFWE